jgi:hypothetical protein
LFLETETKFRTIRKSSPSSDWTECADNVESSFSGAERDLEVLTEFDELESAAETQEDRNMAARVVANEALQTSTSVEALESWVGNPNYSCREDQEFEKARRWAIREEAALANVRQRATAAYQ